MFSLFSRILFALPPETAHAAVRLAARLAPGPLIRVCAPVVHPALSARIGDTPLLSPVGLAAGFDKNAEIIRFFGAVGFGFVEVGSVTLLPGKGNAKPRIARLVRERSLINAMGLPSDGAEAVRNRLSDTPSGAPYGVNIAVAPDPATAGRSVVSSNPVAELCKTYRRLHGFGAYTVFNASCPNSGESLGIGDTAMFTEFAAEISRVRKRLKDSKPMLVKLSPDTEGTALAKIVRTALDYGFDGFIAGNTTRGRPDSLRGLKPEWRARGGLSGALLGEPARKLLLRVRACAGDKALVIACGGIMGTEDAIDRFRSGADLLQVYTGLVYGGPLFVRELNRGIASYCAERGYGNYAEIRGGG